jgi:serine/threonine-protein kinase
VYPSLDVNSDATDPLLGAVIHERYRVLETIGSGAMAVVYRGERIQLGRPVAIKFLLPTIAANADLRRRFELEAQAMSRLNHPHCVSVIDSGVHADRPYLVMDYVTGPTLRAMLTEGPLPVERVLRMTRQVLAALSAAHDQGIIHRDIKPENIVQTVAAGLADHVRILDFGLAKLLESDSRVPFADTASGSGAASAVAALVAAAAASAAGPRLAVNRSLAVMGTPKYMSPEQTQGGDVDARSDLYGVGILLFEMLTGQKPCESDDLLEVLRFHREGPRPRLADVAPQAGFSRQLEAVLQKALAADPAARYQTAPQMSAALDATPEGMRARANSVMALLPQLAGQIGALFGREMTGRQRLHAREDLPGRLPATPESLATAPSQRTSLRLPLTLLAVALIASTAAAVFYLQAATPVRGLDGTRAEQPAAVVPVAPPSPPPPQQVVVVALKEDGITPAERAEAERLISIGDVDGRPLPGRPHRPPPTARVRLVQGHIYFERLWIPHGLQAYRAAIKADPSLRSDTQLQGNAIHTLGNVTYQSRAVTFLVKDVGAKALTALQEAALKNPDSEIRARAARLLGRLPPE